MVDVLQELRFGRAGVTTEEDVDLRTEVAATLGCKVLSGATKELQKRGRREGTNLKCLLI